MRSCNAMACAAALAVVMASSACGSSTEETRPVDAKFRATVEGEGVPEGSVVSVDVFWLPNGQVDVRFDDVENVIPGPDELKGVAFTDGNDVLVEGRLEVVESEEKHQVRLEGSIAPEALDLDLTDTPPGGEATTVRLRGDARPFSTVDDLDGEYLVYTEYYPAHCPGDDRPPPPGQNVRLDVLASGDGARLLFDGQLLFTVPITDGSVDWAGQMTNLRYQSSFDATAAGTLMPADLSLTLEVAAPESGPGCVDRLVLTGAKRLAVPYTIDGDYRADIVWIDGCSGDEQGTFSAPISLVEQDDGMVDFHEYDGSWMQFDMAVGEKFSGDFIDIFGSFAIIHYEGVPTPPEMSYTATYTYQYEDGPCDVTLDVTAYKRYFFPTESE